MRRMIGGHARPGRSPFAVESPDSDRGLNGVPVFLRIGPSSAWAVQHDR
jgi:hypothetical protein